eukprot:6456871-Amphidinium_carterae.2
MALNSFTVIFTIIIRTRRLFAVDRACLCRARSSCISLLSKVLMSAALGTICTCAAGRPAHLITAPSTRKAFRMTK